MLAGSWIAIGPDGGWTGRRKRLSCISFEPDPCPLGSAGYTQRSHTDSWRPQLSTRTKGREKGTRCEKAV
eukprot:202251-Chlamydomonas_euryale.AAC.1